MGLSRKLRIVVCGSVFGQIYMNALSQENADFVLSGIVSHGSPRSLTCAEHLGVPHYSSVDDIPDDVDVACVVVRGGILGGQGSEMARDCLRRGLHVLQEHPVHRDELAETLKIAHGSGRGFMLNSFYPHLPETRRTLHAVHQISQMRPLQWIDVMSSFQVAFALLDVVGVATNGLRNWKFDPETKPVHAGWPWQSVAGEISGIPISIRVQMEMDPADPDNHNILLHRMNFGFAGGTLTQTDVHGPLVWTAHPEFPDKTRAASSRPYFETELTGPPASMCLSNGTPLPYSQLFASSWADAVRHAVHTVGRMIDCPGLQRKHAQRMLAVSRCWMDLSAILGAPSTVPRLAADPLSQEELESIMSALNTGDNEDG